MDRIGGLSRGRRLSFVDPQLREAEYGSEEHDVERDVGRLSGPWNGRLGRLSTERDLLDVERRTR